MPRETGTLVRKVLPGHTAKRIEKLFLDLAENLRRWFDGVDATETDRHSELVKFAENMTNSESKAVAFGTEAPYYNELGLETIVMGPGSINQAHQPDEYIETRVLDPAVDIIRQLVTHYCY